MHFLKVPFIVTQILSGVTANLTRVHSFTLSMAAEVKFKTILATSLVRAMGTLFLDASIAAQMVSQILPMFVVIATLLTGKAHFWIS